MVESSTLGRLDALLTTLDRRAIYGQAGAMKMRLIATVFVAIPSIARAADFELAGLRSGMTEAQARASAPAGFDFKTIGSGSAVLHKGYDIYAAMAFCRGRIMSVSRMIDPDVDFMPAVEAAVRERGQPQVLMQSQPWAGPGGGNVASMVLRWVKAGVRYYRSRLKAEMAADTFATIARRRCHSSTSPISAANCIAPGYQVGERRLAGEVPTSAHGAFQTQDFRRESRSIAVV